MANVLKCDRCGKIFSRKEGGSLSHEYTYAYANKLRRFFNFFLKEPKYFEEYIDAEYDICQECGESFIDWFQSGKKDGDKK